MYLYLGLALFYLVCMVLERTSIKNGINRKLWLFFLALPLFIIAAFRAPSIGNDTFNYFRSYMSVSQESFFSVSQSRMEIGYIVYMRLIALFGFSYLGFQVITSGFTLFSVSRFIGKYSTNIALSFFIFITTRMFFGMMNISRQYLAMAIILFSVEFIKNRKPFKFTILVLLASSIHFTAIVFLVAYPLSRIKLDLKKTIQLLIIGIISGVLFDQLIQIFVNLTGRYAGYLTGRYFNFKGNIAIYLSLLINFLFFLVAFFTRYWRYGETQQFDSTFKSKREEKLLKLRLSDEKLWYTFCLLTLIISIVGLNATILSRVESYFSIFFLAFIPSVLRAIKSQELRALILLGIVAGLLASFVVVMVYRPYWTGVFPYQWYWNW